MIEATDEEVAALLRILTDAQDYWIVCGYGDDADADDRLLGRLAEAGQICRYADCFVDERRSAEG